MHCENMASVTSLDSPVNDVRIVTLGDIVTLIVRSWRFVAAGALLCCFVGVGIALLTPRVYRAEVVAVTTEDASSNPLSRIAGQFGSLAALGGINLPSETNRNETLALLRSKEFATRIIEEEGLMPVLFARRWDAATRRWRVTSPADVPTLSDAWELFDKRVRTVIEDRDRGLVTLRIELHDRKLAADLANSMVARLNDALRQRKLQELDDSIQYLQRESIKTTLLPIRDVMASVMETQVSERMLATARKDYALRVIDPATMPDARRYVQPKPVLAGALGFVLGGMLGFAMALVRLYRRRAQL
jgi:uncharacterized protein involved in exopolysaccharide biosynthesis